MKQYFKLEDNIILEVFEVDTDAPAVARGFYYQYLVVLAKWIDNYISKENTFIYSEVGDDIKEVGDKLIFTQVKSYSSNLSLKSKAIRSSLFNFYLLFLKNKENLSTQFCFYTNTSITPSEKLLKSWIGDPSLEDKKLRAKSISKIRTLLKEESKSRKNKKLNNDKISETQREKIKLGFRQLTEKIEDAFTETFVTNLQWVFEYNLPETSVDSLFDSINDKLHNPLFKQKPASILRDVFLSEIFRCSQKPDPATRVLTNETIDHLLIQTDKDLDSYINNQFLNLIKIRIADLESKVNNLQSIQQSQNKILIDLREDVNELKGSGIKKLYPKFLTAVPFLNHTILGRSTISKKLFSKLQTSKAVSISGYTGIGKTVFVQYYLKTYENEYDHILWITFSNNLCSSILLNVVLLDNLEFKPFQQLQTSENLSLVCNVLGQISGKNIIVIDDFYGDQIPLQQILGIQNWHVIITSRVLINGADRFVLPELTIDTCKQIFYREIPKSYISNNHILEDLISYIQRNPSVIELSAKTILNSLDLNLEEYFENLKNLNLDAPSLDIHLHLAGENQPTQIISYFHNKLKRTNLTAEEEFHLEFLALLPYDNVNIDELALIGGLEHFEPNRTLYTNIINSLHKKGWLERQGKEVKMYRFTQDIIKYSLRKNVNPYVGFAPFFGWLTHRIDENLDKDPQQSFIFLKYAESILSSIKIKDRTSISQPLIILENALLNGYRFLGKSNAIHDRWIDLAQRAKEILSLNEFNLGTILCNTGLSYLSVNQYKQALDYLNKGISVYKGNLPQSTGLLINALCNKALVYVKLEYPSEQAHLDKCVSASFL